MLLFKKKFLEAIRSGQKTQTIRLWKHRMMRDGQRSYIPGIGPIRILSVEQVAVDQLRDEDAVPDGFADAETLKTELRSIYGEKLAAGYHAFRVRFRVGDDQPAPS
ncbi:ASCH domain-containing protein [Aeoliella sp. ICT_H6.2]|uniref:ASCH domain-containing protein n=1 Tax=Aeoliella straminimaris TaxID=2954799 RepID=A0A9X2F6L5_9BACT|nr:ASCH domain-containing protein [Aeoliella straminimaris]MCO6042603.1 ASCH domain-containing protein [Aeoliella straminimaris]